MKTRCTQLLTILILLASQFIFAQAPLLPLFENNTIKWGASSYSMGSICSNDPNVVYSFHEILNDTVINSEVYKIIATSSKNCITCGLYPNTITFCNNRTTKKYVKQEGNLIIEVGYDGSLIDTLLYMDSTRVGSRVVFTDNTFSVRGGKIESIDTVMFENIKIRKFNFGQGLGYTDGIGFDDNGPFSTGVRYMNLEIGSSLNCYTRNGISYTMERNGQYMLISAIRLSTTACRNSLGLEEETESNSSSVFVNQNNQLETSQIATSIEIFDSKGQRILQKNYATKTNVATLSSGIYIANITFANKQMKYKFLVNN